MKEVRESNYPRAKSMQLTLKWHFLIIAAVKKKLGPNLSRRIYLCAHLHISIYNLYWNIHKNKTNKANSMNIAYAYICNKKYNYCFNLYFIDYQFRFLSRLFFSRYILQFFKETQMRVCDAKSARRVRRECRLKYRAIFVFAMRTRVSWIAKIERRKERGGGLGRISELISLIYWFSVICKMLHINNYIV